ncbi:hypothetical protein [Neorhizobium huautlense]|uniref:hypothetical protein n=1 Tax=Neorhizobium huautlense TaxID=67774 RepID=UPI00130027A0|nr:hypothetical protein [Neorhizobium huautlense]
MPNLVAEVVTSFRINEHQAFAGGLRGRLPRFRHLYRVVHSRGSSAHRSSGACSAQATRRGVWAAATVILTRGPSLEPQKALPFVTGRIAITSARRGS